VNGLPLVERGLANSVSVNNDGVSLSVNFKQLNGNVTATQAIQTVEGGQVGALLILKNEFIPKLEQRLNTAAISLVKVANETIVDTDNPSIPIAIFGFKVSKDNEIKNIASFSDLDPEIDSFDLSSEAHVTSLYRDLGSSNSLFLANKLIANNFVSIAPTDTLNFYNINPDTELPDTNRPKINSIRANDAQEKSSLLGNIVADLVTDVGVQVATWKNSQKANDTVLANLKDQRDQLSGVNLDEEAANLLKYQQLYSASTKILQTGNQMFNTLLAIMN
jgi:flagellar hook-associated protein FlgK